MAAWNHLREMSQIGKIWFELQQQIDKIDKAKTEAEMKCEIGRTKAEDLRIEVDAEQQQMQGRIASLEEVLRQAQMKRGVERIRDCLLHAMARAMTNWRSMVSWKAKVAQQELLANFESAMDQLEQLRESTGSASASRAARTMQRVLDRICLAKLAAGWRTWVEEVVQDRAARSVLCKVMLRANQAAIAWGLRQWLDVMASDAEQGYIALQQALHAAQTELAQLKESKSARNMQRLLDEMCLSKLCQAWRQWDAWRQELGGVGQLMKRLLHKWGQAECRSKWGRWKQAVQMGLWAEKKVAWFVRRISTVRLARAVSKWREVVAWAAGESMTASAAQITALRGRCETLKGQLHEHELEVEVLRPQTLALKRSKMFFVFTAMARFVDESVRTAWSRWVVLQLTEQKGGALLKRCLDQITNALVVQGMNKWAAVCRSMKQGGAHWRAGALLNRMMGRWSAGVLEQVWMRWVEAVVEMKVGARAIIRRLLTVADACVGAAWQQWACTVEHEKHASRKLQRYLMVRARGSIEHSLRKWAVWARSQRERAEKESGKMQMVRAHELEVKGLQSSLALQTDKFERLKQEAGSTVALLKVSHAPPDTHRALLLIRRAPIHVSDCAGSFCSFCSFCSHQ
jgi:hypothetical protein